MSQNNSEEINFQHYVDLVKQNKLRWNTFIDVLQDLSYSDMGRLRKLNAILLTELTTNYSDWDKMKYLNGILLIEFKNLVKNHIFTSCSYFSIIKRLCYCLFFPWVHNIFKNDKGKEFFVCRVFFSKNSLKQEEIRAL